MTNLVPGPFEARAGCAFGLQGRWFLLVSFERGVVRQLGEELIYSRPLDFNGGRSNKRPILITIGIDEQHHNAYFWWLVPKQQSLGAVFPFRH